MDKRFSKFLSLILRHKPETLGISLDEHGWADVDELLEGIRKTGRIIDLPTLERIVEEFHHVAVRPKENARWHCAYLRIRKDKKVASNAVEMVCDGFLTVICLEWFVVISGRKKAPEGA